MERWEMVNLAAKPLDNLMGLGLDAIKYLGLLEPTREKLYDIMKIAMRTQFELMNDLEAEGMENIPKQGGAILAPNHQSWLDVQVLAASAPRKVNFVAKSMFKDWPFLHHLIELTDSPYIHRGGDDDGLREVADALQAGKLICIFPEGTIPGEENYARWEVEPETGLLRGKTGAIRLALMAGVPIIPVGISGTGRALPPEVYPRLQQIPSLEKVKVTVRFGQPIYYRDHALQDCTREELRDMTNELMKQISKLIDFDRAYEPVKLPLEPKTEPQRVPPYALSSKPRNTEKGLAPCGVLVLHGFTSHISCVSPIEPLLVERNIPYRFPLLRGHGTKYQDLAGVTASDWYRDAEDALLDLLKECEQAIVIGFSMGGLVSLELSARHAAKIAGTIAIAPSLRFADPLSVFTPMLAKFIKTWPSPNAFNDKERAKLNQNYPKFMTEAFASLYNYAQEITHQLSFVKTPLVLLQSRKDQVVAPKSVEIIRDKVSTKDCQIVWFERNGHEMFLDLEADAVIAELSNALDRFLQLANNTPATTTPTPEPEAAAAPAPEPEAAAAPEATAETISEAAATTPEPEAAATTVATAETIAEAAATTPEPEAAATTEAAATVPEPEPEVEKAGTTQKTKTKKTK
jgi:carboxylesterase